MKKNFLLSFLLAALIILPGTSCNQNADKVIGKIYTKEEANKTYGPVLKSIKIKTSTLDSLARNAPDKILFNIINDKIVVLNAKRMEIYGAEAGISDSTVFHLYSTSQLQSLLKSGGSDSTQVELRDSVFSITNGNYTLELSADCPPNCI